MRTQSEGWGVGQKLKKAFSSAVALDLLNSGESLSEQALIMCMCDVYDTLNTCESKELDRRSFVARHFILSSRKFSKLFPVGLLKNFLRSKLKYDDLFVAL